MDVPGGDDFDPLSLLVARKLVDVDVEAEVFTSVDEFEAHLLNDEREIVEQLIVEEAVVAGTASKTATADVVQPPTDRQALLGTLQQRRPRPPRRDVVSALERRLYPGPLGALCSWVRDGRRLQVTVRSRDRVHSVLTATVVAFDKFWNLALADVDETYLCPKRVRKFRRASALPLHVVPACLRYDAGPKVSSNVQQLRRRLPRLFVRGDNVVSVSLKC